MTRLTIDIPTPALTEQIINFLNKFESVGVKIQQSEIEINVLESIKNAF